MKFHVSFFFVFFLCVEKSFTSHYTHIDDCPDEWVQYKREKCFKFIPTKKSEKDAEEDCRKLGGNLAAINSPEEHRFIVDYFLREIPYDHLHHTWIGGRRTGINHHRWIWTDLSSFTYSRWFPGYPANSTNACLALATGTHNFRDLFDYFGNFFNAQCSFATSYTCQKVLRSTSCVDVCLADVCDVPKKK